MGNHMNRSLPVLIGLTLSLALSSTSLMANDDDPILPPLVGNPRPQYVYRVDSSPPAVLFAEGLTSRGPSLNLVEHALGISCNDANNHDYTAWLSTTSDRTQALEFLRREFERGQSAQPAGVPQYAWLYTVRTDATFYHVPTLMRRLILLAEQHLDDYWPDHAEVIRHIVSRSRIDERNEIVTTIIPPTSIRSAVRITYAPNNRHADQLVSAETTTNGAFNVSTQVQPMHNFLPRPVQLHFPRTSLTWSAFNTGVHSARVCFQSCDGAARDHRRKRSIGAAALNYCQAEAGPGQLLIGSED